MSYLAIYLFAGLALFLAHVELGDLRHEPNRFALVVLGLALVGWPVYAVAQLVCHARNWLRS